MSANIVVALGEVFKEHGWPTHRPENAPEPDASLFSRFCKMLERLNKDQQELILQLARDFLKCPLGVYHELFDSAAGKLSPSDLGVGADVIFLPLKKFSDAGLAKSGSCVVYLAKQYASSHSTFSCKRNTFYDNIELLGQKHDDRTNATIVLLDDYVGTGRTATTALEEFDKWRRQDDTVIVMTLVSLKTGYDAVADKGVKIVASHIRPQGLTGSTRIANKQNAIHLMESIEQLLSVPSGYSFGFQRSEGLESMIRTPNNTFPVFWVDKMANGKDWPAPFPRAR